ncbi:uncharacterized protein LOC114528448 [Dendronephthya gigantea]|uniref:uncharacterized protein LOC114528448 n=1 Tax=Dendronephthya gigantea TaxID=151771 RepID=UPI00106A695F|nr:uncharacterized protein LOC114528448 [Dendronephthya gigantea]XP_028405887.1 uncharacterized protein LOC114528448 [Dendronephthya gigantea]
MAKSDKTKPSEPENIDTTLDTVLITALQENFEVKSGCHIDRNEILEFLRSVIVEHPELNFVLQHRDTKLSSRIYKAFPKVTTKRVAVPNIRGKKTWTYTNLRRIAGVKDTQTKQDTKPGKTPVRKAGKNEETKTKTEKAVESSSLVLGLKRERRQVKSKRNIQSASMVHRNSFFETYKQESSKKRNRIVGNVPHHSYLGRFNDMLNWVKEHYILDKNSSVQVKHIVECIKTEFKINITYKQSHKLIFAVFPGTTSRVEHPVKIEAHGGYYSYKGVAPMPKPGSEEQTPIAPEMNHSPAKSIEAQLSVTKSVNTKQTQSSQSGSAALDDGRKRIFRTRKRFIEACAVLKPAEEALTSPDSYDVLPMNSDVLHKAHAIIPRVSDVSPSISEGATRLAEGSLLSDMTPRFSELSPRLSDVSPRFSKVTPKFYELPPSISDDLQRCESNWQRLYEELKQERDQAIVERNQAMVSLMEIEREQAARTPDDVPRCQATPPEVVLSISRATAKSNDRRRENPDWLRSLISRSNSILGEQMSEANAVYFPGSTLQRSSPGFLKQSGNSADYPDLERYEQLKQERDVIWKNCIEKLRTEKDNIIQQLKLEKVEVIQRMEMDKSDAVESVEEKLTNQVTILTREMRELKELLNHTMNERTLAIDHAHKLMKLVGEEKLKEAGLDHLPFDVTSDHIVHPPKLNSPDETVSQKPSTSLAKGNKRKQSMPAKLKKVPRLETSVSTDSEKQDLNISDHRQTVSTDSENLLIDLEFSYVGRDTVNSDIGGADAIINTTDRIINNTDSGRIDNRAIGDESDDSRNSDKFDLDNDACGTSDFKTLEETVCTPPQKCSPTPPADNSTSPKVVFADERTNLNSSMEVLDSESILNSEFSRKGDSNLNISKKPDNIIASSASEKNDDLTITKLEVTNSKLQIDVSGNANVISNSNQDILEKLNASESSSTSENCQISDECQTSENLGASLKSPSQTNSEKKFAASPTNSCNIDTNYENSSTDSPQSTGSFPGKSGTSLALNTPKYYFDTSGNFSSVTLNSKKYSHELQQPLNFSKYVTEIPRNVLHTEVQKVDPVIMGDSEYIKHESTKSFEESINSTFLKYFPEIPKSSFNSPLTGDSGKYFRDLQRTVRSSVESDSQKYIQDHGNQALVFSDKEGIPEQSKVSSIDFLNSMVENIGKPTV